MAVGQGSVRCDDEHDDAWSHGPTCPCNSGPLCRRRHRVEQRPMSKARGPGSTVHWTDPTGRTWTSPPQHDTPQPAVRPLPARAEDKRYDLSPDALLELTLEPDDDPVHHHTLRASDTEPHEPSTDRLADRISTDTGWERSRRPLPLDCLTGRPAQIGAAPSTTAATSRRRCGQRSERSRRHQTARP